ncbi:NAD(P)/FAD-dependent oxidoreductase [Alkalicoccobacillus porphyridii]|uniref:FAD-binding oxidoreductase n=1 Tax=Alkalicoccobacillus porphyridii TaxID=2597270 RepID=A0A553ZXK7_9BACI|nr:FAD-dependent oxidoreductase [Alkalicoccobacillus porphyridii]TSB46191.1 FAD-binding oxidoreductase [Alkalicoccobacillus porphyridii]
MKKHVIIGAGILGASAAYHLARAGEAVTIIDRADPGQATQAAAGIICPWISQRRNKAWYALVKAGAAYYPSLIKELEAEGEHETGYKRVGALSLHTDPKKLDELVKRAEKRKLDAPEIGKITRLSAQEVQELFPPISEKIEGVHISGAARVDGAALKDALLRSATRHGAEMVSGDAVLVLDKDQKVVIRVNDAAYHADSIVVTAGAWADNVLASLNIKFNVQAQKAQILHLELPEQQTDHWPVVIPQGDQYLLAFEEGRIVAGATHEDNVGFDQRVTASGSLELLSKALHHAPGLADASVQNVKVGFRPFTPNFLPVIGRLPGYEHILVANGLGATGLTMGPYLGSELAKMAIDLETEIDLSLYSLSHAMKKDASTHP